MDKQYFAFISYQRNDESWAMWLAHELEHFLLPTTPNGRDDLPQNLRPIFRDIDELRAGNLPQQIHEALENSKNLIVICSRYAAQNDTWVNKEITDFIEMGRVDRIFPFIIDGSPHAKDSEQECFPKALLALSGQEERLGANVQEDTNKPIRLCRDCPLSPIPDYYQSGNINDKGRDAAVVKLVAGMLDLQFDELWQRYEREKAAEEQRLRKERERLQCIKNLYLSEKANLLLESGDNENAIRIALSALPEDFEDPDTPYVAEAEQVLRKAMHPKDREISIPIPFPIQDIAYNEKYGKIAVLNQTNSIAIFDIEKDSDCFIYPASAKNIVFSHNNERLALVSEDKIELWDWRKIILCQNEEEQSQHKRFISYPYVKYVSFCPKETNILVMCRNNKLAKVCPWRDEISILWEIELPSYTKLIRYSADGGTIYVIDATNETIFLINSESGAIILQEKFPAIGLIDFSISSDGKQMIGIYEDATERIWAINRFTRRIAIDEWNTFTEIDHLRDFKFNTTHIRNALICNGKIGILDFSDNHLYIRPLQYHNASSSFDIDPISAIAYHSSTMYFSSSGHFAATAYADIGDSFTDYHENIWDLLKLRVWDCISGKRLYVSPDTLKSRIIYLTFSYDEKWLLYADTNGDVCILDTGSFEKVLTVKSEYNQCISLISLSRDSSLLVICYESYVNIIDTHSGEIIKTIYSFDDIDRILQERPQLETIFRYVYEEDEKVRICLIYDESNGLADECWNMGSNIIISRPLPINTNPALSLKSIKYGLENENKSYSFSNDGKLLVRYSENKAIDVLDAETHICLHTCYLPTEAKCVKMSNDGKRIYALYRDSSIRILSYTPLYAFVKSAKKELAKYAREYNNKEKKQREITFNEAMSRIMLYLES